MGSARSTKLHAKQTGSRVGSVSSKSSTKSLDSVTESGKESSLSKRSIQSAASNELDDTFSSSSSEDSSSSSDGETSDSSEESGEKNVRIVVEQDNRRKEKVRKRFTLPFFFNYLAWILCLGAIGVSVFYLWAYGVMFGNDKTYQWLTSSIACFWSGMLIVEPLKVSIIFIKYFKSGDLIKEYGKLIQILRKCK